MFQNKKNTQIMKMYIFTFFGNIYLDRGIFMIYLMSKGLSLLEAGFFQALINISMIIAELPTGLIADKYGKKISILVAKVLMIIYLVLMLFSNSVIGFYAAAILMGIAYTFTSGAEEAFLYDMIKQSGIEERATKYMGLYEGIITIAIALAMGFAGYIQAINWNLVFIISIIFQVVSLGVGVTLKEVEVQHEDNVDNHRLGYREIIVSCVDFLKNNKNTRGYIVATSLNVGVVSSLYIFAQDILVNNGFDVKKFLYFLV